LVQIVRGTCHVLLVYDVALSIDLKEAERRVIAVKDRGTIKHKRRAPAYLQHQPIPLRISQGSESLTVGAIKTSAFVDLVLYDFGAVSVLYSIPLHGPLQQLLELSDQLYENVRLLEDSRRHVEQIVELVRDAVPQPNISSFVEDYIIFQLDSFASPITVGDVVAGNLHLLAQILRAETHGLSTDEVHDAVSHRISFSPDDLAIIDWNAAVLIGPNMDDTLTVLEFANVDLLEMRYLDHNLDDALELAYGMMAKRTRQRFPFRSNSTELERLARWQVDSAILFEGVNNTLKLIGDQYLARAFRLAAERFHLPEWDASIMRKLQTLESIYSKVSDQVSSRRMETLEWIIIVLIAVSIILPFVVSYSAN
jgi:hypothetical protein